MKEVEKYSSKVNKLEIEKNEIKDKLARQAVMPSKVSERGSAQGAPAGGRGSQTAEERQKRFRERDQMIQEMEANDRLEETRKLE